MTIARSEDHNVARLRHTPVHASVIAGANCGPPQKMRHCERSEAISTTRSEPVTRDCFTSLAMTAEAPVGSRCQARAVVRLGEVDRGSLRDDAGRVGLL